MFRSVLMVSLCNLVGWSIDQIADAALVNSAPNMAAATRSTTRETIIHDDHGAQFTSWALKRATCVIADSNSVWEPLVIAITIP